MPEQPERQENDLEFLDLKGIRVDIAKEAFDVVFGQSDNLEERKNQVVFITSFGLVYSDPDSVERPENSAKTVDGLLEYVEKEVNALRASNPDATIKNTGSYIRIKNAVIQSFDGNRVFGAGDLVLFTDSINAMTFGKHHT